VSIEREKQVAAEAAADLVEDHMTVGLGTGTTVAFLLPALARRSLDIRCAATSPRTEHSARELGLRMEDLASIDRFDITIDGADQITPDGWLVKGGGGAHTREKILAAAADRFVVIADSSKPVEALHRWRGDRRLRGTGRRPGRPGRTVRRDARRGRARAVPAGHGGDGSRGPG